MVQTRLSSLINEYAPSESPVEALVREIAADPLTELQLRVARRADELARSATAHSSLNLRYWLQAEHEVLQALLEG